jgi:hypothetical protein
MFSADAGGAPAVDPRVGNGGNGCNPFAGGCTREPLFTGHDCGGAAGGATGDGYDAGRTAPRVKIEPSTDAGGCGFEPSLRSTGGKG